MRILALLLLTGCASVFEEPYFDWHQDREPSSLPYSVVYYPNHLIPAICGRAPACTFDQLQLIVLPVMGPAWLLPHERRHERGENHS